MLLLLSLLLLLLLLFLLLLMLLLLLPLLPVPRIRCASDHEKTRTREAIEKTEPHLFVVLRRPALGVRRARGGASGRAGANETPHVCARTASHVSIKRLLYIIYIYTYIHTYIYICVTSVRRTSTRLPSRSRRLAARGDSPSLPPSLPPFPNPRFFVLSPSLSLLSPLVFLIAPPFVCFFVPPSHLPQAQPPYALNGWSSATSHGERGGVGEGERDGGKERGVEINAKTYATHGSSQGCELGACRRREKQASKRERERERPGTGRAWADVLSPEGWRCADVE